MTQNDETMIRHAQLTASLHRLHVDHTYYLKQLILHLRVYAELNAPTGARLQYLSDPDASTFHPLDDVLNRLLVDPDLFYSVVTDELWCCDPTELIDPSADKHVGLALAGVNPVAVSAQLVDMKVLLAQALAFEIRETVPVAIAAVTLEQGEQQIHRAIQAGHLSGTLLAGTWRLATWQFDANTPDRLLSHLPEILEAARECGLDSIHLRMVMAGKDQGLANTGPSTPVEWLRSGRSPEPILKLISAETRWLPE